MKNHDFTPKNLIFSNFRGGGGALGAPPSGSAPAVIFQMRARGYSKVVLSNNNLNINK